MANLPLPAPFTEHVSFSLDRAHCHLSSHPGKHLHATLCQCKCLRACLYKVHVSQGGYVAGSEVRLPIPPFFFAFDLNPRALASRAGSLLPTFVFKRSACCLFLQASPLSVSGEHELWPVKSTLNNKLMELTGFKRVRGLLDASQSFWNHTKKWWLAPLRHWSHTRI